MADGASPLTDKQNITVDRSSNSGSVMYEAMKRNGIHANNTMSAWLDGLEAYARQADATYSAGMDAITSSMRILYGAWGIAIPEPSQPQAGSPMAAWLRSVHDLQSSGVKAINNSAFYSSPEYAKMMWDIGKTQGADTQVNDRLNDRFFTHNSTRSDDPKMAGSLNEASAGQVHNYFKPGESEKWPNLILTSSHALVRDHKDVSDVLKGFHALITQAYGNGSGNHRAADLDLIRTLNGSDEQPAKDRSKPPRTIMLSAVYNDKNAMVNGGTLLLRMHHLADVGKHYKDIIVSPQERERMEQAYLGSERDGTQMSHASINLGRLILSLIVQKPEQLGEINRPNDPAFYRDPFITPATAIKLRPDADDVLQHIKLAGYSKGGTIVTDALRFLILQLEHLNHGKACFQDHAGKDISAQDIARMMTHMGVLCVNPGINPLSVREQQLGIRRMTVRNDNDIVTSHLFKKYADDPDSGIKIDASGDVDNVYVVNGSKDNLGHGIEEALGSRKNAGYLMSTHDQDPEYVVKAEIKSRLQSFFASCYGKMGLSQVKLETDGSECALKVELSTGVTFEQFKDGKRPAIIEGVLKKAGFEQIRMQHDDSQASPYKGVIHFNAPKEWSKAGIRSACRDALDSLNQQPEHNIFVSKTSLDQLNAPDVAIDAGAASYAGRMPTTTRVRTG